MFCVCPIKPSRTVQNSMCAILHTPSRGGKLSASNNWIIPVQVLLVIIHNKKIQESTKICTTDRNTFCKVWLYFSCQLPTPALAISFNLFISLARKFWNKRDQMISNKLVHSIICSTKVYGNHLIASICIGGHRYTSAYCIMYKVYSLKR